MDNNLLRNLLITLLLLISISSHANILSNWLEDEIVFVETPLDTDSDGKKDLIYVKISRPNKPKKFSTILKLTPYSLLGEAKAEYQVDYDTLPQDISSDLFHNPSIKSNLIIPNYINPFVPEHNSNRSNSYPYNYAYLNAHSLGTGESTGCPSIGGESEAIAGKSIIDWLNGRARAFDSNGNEVKADWANGNVGMEGTSYDGTLAIMVASTGVKGLKAIIPVAAISSWYEFYRSHGLVIHPNSGPDWLGYYVTKKRINLCKNIIQQLALQSSRDTGDYNPFWQERDYLKKLNNIKAATFIINGQTDNIVKFTHGVKLYDAIKNIVPTRLMAHGYGHGIGGHNDVRGKIDRWFDYYVHGIQNNINKGPQIEIETKTKSKVETIQFSDGLKPLSSPVLGLWYQQSNWPNESTKRRNLFLESTLSNDSLSSSEIQIIDSGREDEMSDLIQDPDHKQPNRAIFLSEYLDQDILISGTPKINLSLSIQNRSAANITVYLVEYYPDGTNEILTRGWADPQNYKSIHKGEKLTPGKKYQLSFQLQPRQHLLSKGSRLGVVLASTDKDYTMRPNSGTIINFYLGDKSSIEINTDKKINLKSIQ